MRGGRWNDGVDGLDDAVKGRVRSDGHVGAAEVVVDGSNHAHDVEMGVADILIVSDEIPEISRF